MSCSTPSAKCFNEYEWMNEFGHPAGAAGAAASTPEGNFAIAHVLWLGLKCATSNKMP